MTLPAQKCIYSGIHIRIHIQSTKVTKIVLKWNETMKDWEKSWHRRVLCCSVFSGGGICRQRRARRHVHTSRRHAALQVSVIACSQHINWTELHQFSTCVLQWECSRRTNFCSVQFRSVHVLWTSLNLIDILSATLVVQNNRSGACLRVCAVLKGHSWTKWPLT